MNNTPAHTVIDTPAGPITRGCRISYTAFGGTRRYGIVIDAQKNVKNGRPGFDLLDENRVDEWWGYADQVTSVKAPNAADLAVIEKLLDA